MTTNVIDFEAALRKRRRARLDAATNEAIDEMCVLSRPGLRVARCAGSGSHPHQVAGPRRHTKGTA